MIRCTNIKARHNEFNYLLLLGIKKLDRYMSFITKKIVYVAKSLYFLEVVQGNEMTSVVEISTALDIPKRFLEQLFLRLRKNGIVESVRGAQGGYRLLRPLQDITFHELSSIVSDSRGPGILRGVSGRFGEAAFVAALADHLNEVTSEITLGSLLDAQMRRKAMAGRVGGYVYQI